jgi:ribosome-binding protein aMBF1 (putative translation factor)
MSRAWSDIRKEIPKSEASSRGYEEARLAYDLSVRVKEAREAKGLSQSQLADRMGTQQSVIARLEGGGITPTVPTLKRIADALGTKLVVDFDEPPNGREVKTSAVGGGKVSKKGSSSGRYIVKVAKTARKKPTSARAARRRAK